MAEDSPNSLKKRRDKRNMLADRAYEELAGCATVSPARFEQGLAGEIGPGMDERYGRIILSHGLWETALGFAFHKDRRVAFRASWALEWAYFNDGDSFGPYTNLFLENYMRATNPSVHRHYTKMLCDMLRRGMITPSAVRSEQIAEKTFDLLIDPQTRVAVKVWCMEILFDLATEMEWVAEHLEDTVRTQMERYPSPAMTNHGYKLLRRIAKRKSRSLPSFRQP